jgi:hypothetical protein
MLSAATLNRGMAVDVMVGEPITLHPSTRGGRIVVTIEHKSGQRGRIRIQAEEEVRIELPKKDT